MVQRVVRQRADGRGMDRPFGNFSGAQYGEYVEVGDTRIPVSKDGRIIYPKSIMEKYGETGADGRKRIIADYSSRVDRKGNQYFAARVLNPTGSDKNLKTGDVPQHGGVRRPHERLLPKNAGQHTWSPL